MPHSYRPRPSPAAVETTDTALIEARQAFGESVRRARRDQHLSQERLAHDVDLHMSMIGRVERGEVSPSLDTMMKIASGLGVELVELMGGAPRADGDDASRGPGPGQ